MEGHQHSLSGALAFAAFAPLIHPGPAALAAGVVFTAGAALVPDIDEPGSTLSRESGVLTVALAHVIRKLSGGHRKLTHSVAGVAVFTAAAWGAVLLPDHVHGLWPHLAACAVPWFFLQALLAAALHALRLGKRSADPLAALAATAALWQHWGLSMVPLCIALGMLAHIAGDMLTKHGCPLALPFTGRDFHLLPGPMRISTGKLAEHWLVSPVLTVALGLLCWRYAAASIHINPAVSAG